MMESWLPWLLDGLVLVSLFILTVVIAGLFRMPDVYLQLHAAGKAVVLGVIPMLLSIALLGEAAIAVRALLIGVFFLLTAPVSSHAIARAAFLRDEPMKGPDALDESNRLAHVPDDRENR